MLEVVVLNVLRVLRVLAAVVAVAVPAAAGTSYYTARLVDPKAVHLEAFGARGDGVADDTDAIQRAIDRVHETVGQGIVLVPEGRYRITATINVWPSIRLIGYGAKRPVIVIGPNTPGYQDRDAERQMVFFAGSRPGFGRPGAPPAAAAVPAERPPDATPGTFYSAISNIDFEIGDGNHGAVAVRGTYAQHCFLAHMDIRIGPGIAGVHDTGNVMEDVRFLGGTYGLWTRTPSPGWQFTAVDVYFEGQREAAIRERAAGLTLVRPHFRNVPAAVSIDEDSHDELWIKDGRMEDVSGPAILVGLEDNPRTQINLENVVCRRVPAFARLRTSGKTFPAPGEIYEVKVFSHGLHYADMAAVPAVTDVFETTSLQAMPEPAPSDLVALPPADTWVNVRSLGAKGDGVTDDTEVFRRAIAAHRAIYLPMGYYVISDTLALRPDTVLVGLHPLVTALVLLDRTEAFQGVGPPRAMIEAPKGGTNVMIGVGVYTNGINPRAVGVKWMAGARSMMNDVRLLGGHGTNNLDGTRANPYNNNRTADPDASRRWDSQYPSLWVTDGGGGTFFDIWTPSTFAMAGMLISDTTTEGRVYQMSSEHHVRYEIQVRRAANWRIYAMQTEEERGESGFALPLEIDSSENITFANFHLYRVISSFQPFPWAVKITNSTNIRFRNFHCYSNSKVSFDAAVYDHTHGAEVRQREFAWLDVTGRTARLEPCHFQRARAGDDGAQARRRLLQHLGRRRGPLGRLLLRGCPAPAHLPVGCRRVAPVGRARHPARAREPRRRSRGQPDGGLLRRHRHRLRVQARHADGPGVGAPAGRRRAAPGADDGPTRRRLARGARSGDGPGGAAALPLPVPRRDDLHPGRTRLHDRRAELGGEERRSAAVLRPRQRQPRAAFLRDERVRGDDLAWHPRPRRQPRRSRGLRQPGGRGGRGGQPGARVPGRRPRPGLRPGGKAGRDDRDSRAADATGVRGSRREDAVHRRPQLALRRPDARGGPGSREVTFPP